MKMKLKPLGKKLLVHPLRHSSLSEGGLYLPGNEKKKESQGIVIAIGPQCEEPIKIGDHVFYNAYSGDKVVLGSGGEFFLIHEAHVVCVRTDSDVEIFDSITVKRLLKERRSEMAQKYAQDVERMQVIEEVFSSIEDRIDTFTRAEGFEW